MGKRRRSVLALPMMVMVRKTPEAGKLDGGRWGNLAKRFPGKTRAYSPKLLAYRACIASALSGKHPGTIGKVQSAFTDAAHACKKEVEGRGIKPIKKIRSMTYI
jgi:hypothetical protein